MAPGFGASNPNAVTRFEREARILKKLNHRNIVRLFAFGKHQGTRFYAMEYIVGESLDKVMARRVRVTWEETVELGKQLCAALQQAHEAGIVHRDLKPSNLMVLKDGTLKLTDFGIARDMDLTGITEANCTVGTASYMSPEQCRGERDISPKSDLYSLGVVFYELITGRKPFSADNAMDMFMQHVHGTFTRPSKLVLDLPVWMDNLICQMLEKKPENRPMNAAAVYAALESISERVAAQRSAGVEAVRSRLIDRPRGRRKADDEDKEAARLLLTGKGRPKRKKKGAPFYGQLWFQGVALAALLTALVLVLFLVFRPTSAETLFNQARPLMESKDPEDHEKAYQGPLKEYQTNYAGDKTEPQERKEQMLAWTKEREVEQAEDIVQRLQRNKFAKPKDDLEKAAFDAAETEDAGNIIDARRQWQELSKTGRTGRWGQLADQHLTALKAIENYESRTKDLIESLPPGREPDLSGAEKDVFVGLRFERDGEAAKAREQFEGVKRALKGDHEQRFWYLLAAKKIRDLDPDVIKKENEKGPPRQ
jgi:serine/threonine-protein kinase